MKRSSPLVRKTELKPGTKPLRRRAAVSPQNRRRRAAARLKCFGPQAEWVRDLPCATCGAPPPSDPSHVTSVGAGGKRDRLIPQDARCHGRMHQVGVKTFEAEKGCDLKALAQETAQRWRELPESTKEHYRQIFRQRYHEAGALMDREAKEES